MSKIFEINGIEVDKLIEKFGSPLYVYDFDLMKKRYNELYSAINYPNKKILYACKANSNFYLMKELCSLGAGIDAVSPGEIFLALKAGFNPEDILFTGDNVTMQEIDFCMAKKVPVNIGSLHHLEKFGKKYPGSKVSVRINPDVGAGHHDHVITGGPHTKFGIYHDKIDDIKQIAKKYNLNIFGVHCHIGSGILEVKRFMDAVEIVLLVAQKFHDLDFIDFGGGIGVPYHTADNPIDVQNFGIQLSQRFSKFCHEYGKKIHLYLEPGRYIVSESGYLLVTVNNVKETPEHKFAGVDSGFNHLIRPMAYGSYHEIINATNRNGETESIIVAGNLCESGDVFTRGEAGIEDRIINRVKDGDILVILNAGAYGYSMSSRYNSRFLPAEVAVSGGKSKLIRKRENFKDLLKSAKV